MKGQDKMARKLSKETREWLKDRYANVNPTRLLDALFDLDLADAEVARLRKENAEMRTAITNAAEKGLSHD